MKEFTDNEKIVAKNINKEYKWMARDKSGILCAFIHKPYKDHVINRWNSERPICEMAAFDWMFKSITWSDEEPTLIKDIYDPQILTDDEKRYITTVLSPWKKVDRIRLAISTSDGMPFLYVEFTDSDVMTFPTFKAGTMYRGMEVGRKYTPEELGIKL